MKYLHIILCGLALFLTVLTTPIGAYAQEITLSVTGNGSESQNSVATSAESSTTIQQSNEATIENKVESESNTGANNASSNTGEDVSIETGLVENITYITNESINANIVGSNNGEISLTTETSGNGSDSGSSVDAVIQNNTIITQLNNATITNNVTVVANTGKNTANNNNGNVEIRTGDIVAETLIQNRDINTSFDPGNSSEHISFAIFGNGSVSNNRMSIAVVNNRNVISENVLNLLNNVKHDLNTGYNQANGNVGSVLIATGDIKSLVSIVNENINKNIISPKEKEKPPTGGIIPPFEQPTAPPSQVQPPTQEEVKKGEGNGEGKKGDEAGVGGAVLPVTGGYTLFLLTLASILMFFTGLYLRFKNNSPPVFA